jgi:hypothetical protein
LGSSDFQKPKLEQKNCCRVGVLGADQPFNVQQNQSIKTKKPFQIPLPTLPVSGMIKLMALMGMRAINFHGKPPKIFGRSQTFKSATFLKFFLFSNIFWTIA